MLEYVDEEGPRARERIVDAAREAFRREGIAGTKLGEIATAAGLARPNLYRYFPSREALILEVLITEIRAVNAARREQLTLAGPVAPLILDALHLGHELANEDYLARVALEGDGLAITADLVSREESILAAQYEYWEPVLDYGRARGEIVPHLDNEQIVRWFLTAHVLIAERPALIPNGDVRQWLQYFVVPPVVTKS